MQTKRKNCETRIQNLMNKKRKEKIYIYIYISAGFKYIHDEVLILG